MAVTVAGPPSILNALKPDDLKLVFKPATDNNSKILPSLELAPELQGKVTLKSTRTEPER
jgi:hypothetical protein